MKNQLLSLTKTQKQKINYIIVVEFVEVKILRNENEVIDLIEINIKEKNMQMMKHID